jgi:DNA gyrase subunit A
MVRMAQDWSLRYPLVQGQGNFGSIDGDSPAAMRYTEARLRKISEEMLVDIEKDTVDFQFNFDDSLKEPTVLPTRIPNLLVNGTSGIAVGMATNMAPHNLSEVIAGTLAYIDNNDIDIKGLMQYIKAPDFPTGGIIYGYDGVISAFETGKGRIVMRGETHIEETKSGKEMIIATSIPYQVNKSDMIKKTADLVNDKKISGISDIRDESDRDGIRIVYELKRDANTNVVLNKIYQFTALQTSFSVNNIALVHGRPEVLNLKDIIRHFVEHRHDVVVRRTKYELRQAEKRAHILEGLIIASDNIDEVIKIIRGSKSPDIAREALMNRFDLSDIQARAIVDMRLRHLTGLEQEKLHAEYEELMKTIEHLKNILESFEMRMDIIKEELLQIKDQYGDERKSQIEYSAADFRIEDTIPDDDVVITISHAGYIKRTNLTEYRRQNRGGRGSKGSSTRNEDFLEHLFVASMHNYMLFFTEKGRVFWLRVFEIPEGTRTTKGRAIQNIINIPSDDKVRAYVNTKDLKDEDYVKNNFIILATKKGVIKKTSLELYSRPRVNGINAITVRENDTLLEARLTNGENEVLLAVKSGRAIRFNEKHVRPMGRNASGVRGIRLADDKDEVVGMICLENQEYDILVVSEKGYGKRSKLEDYRETNRGGKGVRTLNVTEKTGAVISIKNVTDNNDLMIINKSGILIRIPVGGETSAIRVMGRNTQGVRLIKIQEGDSIASVAKVDVEEEEIEEAIEILEEGGKENFESTEKSEDGTIIENNSDEEDNKNSEE